MKRLRRARGLRGTPKQVCAGIPAKIAATRREYKPKPKFRPLFEHMLNLAADSAQRGYCTRAGQEIRHAKKVAGY